MMRPYPPSGPHPGLGIVNTSRGNVLSSPLTKRPPNFAPTKPSGTTNHGDFFDVVPGLEPEMHIIPHRAQFPALEGLIHVEQAADIPKLCEDFFQFGNPHAPVMSVRQFSGRVQPRQLLSLRSRASIIAPLARGLSGSRDILPDLSHIASRSRLRSTVLSK